MLKIVSPLKIEDVETVFHASVIICCVDSLPLSSAKLLSELIAVDDY